MPERVVTFGDTYRFGPDLVYAEPEMFYNKTRLDEIYENWQYLFPSNINGHFGVTSTTNIGFRGAWFHRFEGRRYVRR